MIRSRPRKLIILRWGLCLGCLLFAPTALAQTGSLRGHVTDQNGATIVGAKVIAQASSGAARTTTTDKSVVYSFANLPLVDYTINASAPSLILQQPAKI